MPLANKGHTIQWRWMGVLGMLAVMLTGCTQIEKGATQAVQTGGEVYQKITEGDNADVLDGANSTLSGCDKKPVQTKCLDSQEIGEPVTLMRVVDGDTVVVKTELGEETIRLLLIDTPESVHPEKPAQPFGKEASDYLTKHMSKVNAVRLERGDPEKDKYDRTLGYLWADGENVNHHMITKGYARVAYVFEPNTKYLDSFQLAEKQAKKDRRKIWGKKGYVTDKGFAD